ncbi:MAG: hypothetical protein AAFZ87_04340 [Planctomycetota bacterium]
MDDRAADPWRPTREELLEQAAVLLVAANEEALAELVRAWPRLYAPHCLRILNLAREGLAHGPVFAPEELAALHSEADEPDLEDGDRGGAL